MRYQRYRRDFGSWKSQQRRLSVFAGLVLALFFLSGTSFASAANQPAKLSRLIQAARQEGVVSFAGPSSLTPKGAQVLIAALNKKYGLDLKLQYSPSEYQAVGAQLIMEESTGQPPTYDVVLQTETTIGPLLTRNLLEPVDWTGIFPHIREKSVQLNGRAVLTDTMFALPAYNTNLVSARELPKSWEDFLNPKWKGKILVPLGATSMAMNWAQMWGEEKTVQYLRKLRQQKLVFGRFAEVETRLASGEYSLAILELSPPVMQGQAKGAPVAFDTEVKPAFVKMDMMAVMKKARHPNAAKLLAAFTLTQEGQAVWWKYAKRSSLFVKGTEAERFSRGKQLLFPDVDFITKNSGPFRKSFAKALGAH